MKIPKKIRLNGINYDIEWVENLSDGVYVLDGQIDHKSSVIKLNPDTNGYQQQCIVFLHEVCHAFLDLYDIENKGTDERVPKSEEAIVELFARAMYQFLQDNGKKLFDIKDPQNDK